MRNSRLGIFLFALVACFIGACTICLAQSSTVAVTGATEAAPAMADGLRADGKIWVVVVVLATIFAGLLAWLIRTDKRLTRLERERGSQP